MTAGGPSRKICLAELCGRAESIDTVKCGSELHICTLYRELGLGVHIVSLLCRGRKGFVQREEGFQGRRGFADKVASCHCICCALSSWLNFSCCCACSCGKRVIEAMHKSRVGFWSCCPAAYCMRTSMLTCCGNSRTLFCASSAREQCL